jgi:hypothetical protein
MDMQPETKSAGPRTADVVIAYKTISGYNIGRRFSRAINRATLARILGKQCSAYRYTFSSRLISLMDFLHFRQTLDQQRNDDAFSPAWLSSEPRQFDSQKVVVLSVSSYGTYTMGDVLKYTILNILKLRIAK